MTEKEMRQYFVDTACSYLGCAEADGSHRKIIDAYNGIKPLPAGYRMSYSDPWCAAYVSAMAAKCGLNGKVFPECSCDRMIALYKKAGRWEESDAYRPQAGDVIFYDWQDGGAGDCVGGSDHVGIVASVSGSAIKVVEGNISDKVGFRNIAVNARYIRGYGLPDFGVGAGQTEPPHQDTAGASPRPAENGGKLISVRLPELSRGAKGESVRAMQFLLAARGFSCGSCGADGEFGSGTLAAVRNFQRANGLYTDGCCGVNTWAKLLRG